MIKPLTVKVLAGVAMLLALLELVACGILMRQADPAFFFGLLSWVLLLWASFIGFRLASYPLSAYDLKKVWIREWLIIAFAMLSMVTGVVIGLIGAVALLAAMWGLKKNYDEWEHDQAAPE